MVEHIAGTTFNEETMAILHKKNIKQAIIDKSKELKRTPRSWDENSLRSIGTAEVNIRVAMECVCELIFEYYGLNPWEFKNKERVEQVKMATEHIETINNWYNVDVKIDEFMNTKYGDEYRKTHGAPHETDNKINIVEVANHLVQNDLQKWNQKTDLGVQTEDLQIEKL